MHALLIDRQCIYLPVAKAIYRVIVDHAHGLHERITNGAPDKLESAFFQILAHRVRLWGMCRDFAMGSPAIVFWFTIDELPDVAVKRPEFRFNVEACSSVYNGGLNF